MDDLAVCIDEARRRARAHGVAPHDSEDLAQETLARVWQRSLRSRRTGSWLALVRKTVAGLVVDRRRRRRPAEELEDPIGNAASPDELVAASEQRAAVRRAIAALPASQREVVVQRYYHGRKFRQIAERSGLPLNTVLARMHRAARRLRATLEIDDVE